jgi:hypothetical protein
VKVEVRFTVLNCLASPMPERKDKALGILKVRKYSILSIYDFDTRQIMQLKDNKLSYQ